MKKKYETYNHAKVHIRYHLIFSTKYRKSWMQGEVINELKKVFLDISSKSDFRILHIGIDQTHVHLLVSSRPHFSIEQIVRRLKMVSTRRLFSYNENYFRSFYWKKRQIWSGGYFCSTIGEVSENNIISYITNQG